ncbi:MAG: SPASM domain-containing protein [Clostridia bacterium]|jgi:radical SAM protein with 4Fe4S-binding SPASM domain|nr:SPASM domain-containing protein [Clostridia bacterium]
MLDFILKKNKEKRLKISYGCPGFLGLKYEKDTRGYYFNCRTGINIASILYNGDLFVCPNVPRIKHLIQGNIRTDNFKEVWENKYKEFRTKDRTKCEKCEECEWWNFKPFFISQTFSKFLYICDITFNINILSFINFLFHQEIHILFEKIP